MFKLTHKYCVYVDFIEKDDEFIVGYVGKGRQGRLKQPARNSHHKAIAKHPEIFQNLISMCEKCEIKRVLYCEGDNVVVMYP